MTTVWPSNRQAQIDTIRDLYQDLGVLERRFIPAIITDNDDPTQEEFQDSWSATHDMSPLDFSKIASLDSVNGRLTNMNVMNGAFVPALPKPQSNWELLESHYIDEDSVSADIAITMPQTFHKIVVYCAFKMVSVGGLTVRLNNDSTGNYFVQQYQVNASQTTTGTKYASEAVATTAYGVSYGPGGPPQDEPTYQVVKLTVWGYNHDDSYQSMDVESPSMLSVRGGTMTSNSSFFNDSFCGYINSYGKITALTLVDGSGWLPGSRFHVYGYLRA